MGVEIFSVDPETLEDTTPPHNDDQHAADADHDDHPEHDDGASEAHDEGTKVNGKVNGDAHRSETPPPPPQPTNSLTIHSPTPTRAASITTRPMTPDDDPHALVISSLRNQISDLYSQVTGLNAKLVKSYERVSDLEDNLHITTSQLRSSKQKVTELEGQNAQHINALNNGLLVERANVTAELTRLMERATDEAAQRGKAEVARAAIEKDLDDLSTNLFEQANSMVAEARLGQARSERKVEEAQRALAVAEDAVQVMQEQLQTLHEAQRRADAEVTEMRSKGKWVERPPAATPGAIAAPRLLSTHLPYQEFLQFVTHLKTIRPTTIQLPPIATFLPLPFFARLLAEDSEPTLRLDTAPSLNWLTRRSVLAAIHQGQLTIEPLHIASLFLESSSGAMMGQPTQLTSVSCALCGQGVYALPPSASATPAPPAPAAVTNTWTSTTSRFLKNPLAPQSSQPAPAQPQAISRPPSPQTTSLQTVIYVFRLHPQPGQKQQQPTPYPVCRTGWCLARLRTTCALWHFVRQQVVERVWEDAAPPPPPKVVQVVNAGVAPPPPPRRKVSSNAVASKVSSIWGMGLNALGMPGATSPTKAQPTSPTTAKAPPPPVVNTTTTAPPPPIPPRAKAHAITPAPTPPPVPSRNTARTPPLPTRSAKRNSASGLVVPSSDSAPSSPEAARKSVEVEGAGKSVEGAEKEAQEKKEEAKEESAAEAKQEPTPVSTPPGPTAIPPPERTNTDTPPPRPARGDRRLSTGPGSVPSTPTKSAKRGSLPRAITLPHLVPLPDSRPGTPQTAQFPPTMQLASTAEEPRVDSPVPPPTPGTPGVGATGAAPPPVPRRAAARRALAKDGKDTPPPATPTVASTPPPPAASTPPPATASTPPPTTGGTPPPMTAESDAPVGETVPAISEPADAKEAPAPAAAEPSPKKQLQLIPEKQSAAATLAPPPPPPPKSPKPTPEEADQAYVGEATWEERTWRELVQLKEEMFWARVGGVR